MKTYHGTLEYYTEMGEIQAAIANIKHSHPNMYAKWFSFDKKTDAFIRISHPKTKAVMYEGTWTYSRTNTAENSYFPSPVEISPKDWKLWCVQAYEVEIKTEQSIEAEESSLEFSSEEIFDVWEIKDGGKKFIGREVRLYKIQTHSLLEINKPRQRWLSPSQVVNFTYNFKTKKLYVFCEDGLSYLIVPSEKAIMD